MRRLSRFLPTAVAVVAVVAVGAFALGACRGPARPTVTGQTDTGQPQAPATDPKFVVATAKVATLAVYHDPSSATPVQRLANPTADRTPLVLLVADTQPGWLHVLLPVRPNGSQGWVHDSEVTLTTHDFRVEVNLHAHQLTVYEANRVVVQSAIGDGAPATPTPVGRFYTTELLRPPGANSAYGPFAYGLSGHSDVLTSFGGGDGELGLHGTNDPSSIGRDASHGCIRVPNSVITQLASLLPVGVPVDVVA